MDLDLLDDCGEEKLNETTNGFMTALPRVADSNSQDKSRQNAQKVTQEMIQRKGTRLPTLNSRPSFFLASHADKDEDKPIESYSKEVLIYIASVTIGYL